MISIKNISYLNQQGNRENIEDAIYPPPGQASSNDRLFLVCDGVGGESKGEEASRITTEALSAYFNDRPLQPGADVDNYLAGAQNFVIAEMQQYIRRFPEAARMSTTLTLAYLTDNGILIAWCGDSRIYHFRDGEVMWRSTDHSLVSMLVQQGEITEEEAEHHPKKNVILRSISAAGSPAAIETHWLTDVRPGDDILLCTDGVLEQMNLERLRAVLRSPAANKAPLFMTYCEGNTGDNFSLYLINIKTGILGANRVSAPMPANARMAAPVQVQKSKGPMILIVVLTLLLIAAGVVIFIVLKDKQATQPVQQVIPPKDTTTKADTSTNRTDTLEKKKEETETQPEENTKPNDADKGKNMGKAKAVTAKPVITKPQAKAPASKPVTKPGKGGKDDKTDAIKEPAAGDKSGQPEKTTTPPVKAPPAKDKDKSKEQTTDPIPTVTPTPTEKKPEPLPGTLIQG